MALEEKKDSFTRFEGAPVGTIKIQFHDFNEHENIGEWMKTARSMIRLREGVLFSSDLLEYSKRALAL
jgi:hypothetical protein